MLALFRRRSPQPKNLDQQLVFQLSKSRIPTPRQIKYLGHFIKGRERMVLYICIALMVLGLGVVGVKAYNEHIQYTPKEGGRYTEGVVGNPQYINPLYASLNTIDADLERLIFSRLYVVDAKGNTVPDLASGYELSTDEKTYTVTMREATWPDGSAITTDDVIFTFKLIQNPDYRSPLRSRFIGMSAEKKDDKTIIFTLTEPYGQFLSLLDFGILPSALWEGVNATMMPLAELNLKPVGSGPYQLKSLTKTSNGTIRSYTLEQNPLYYGTSPFLQEIVFKFFPSPEEMIGALNKGQLNGIAELSPEYADTIVAKNSLNYRAIIEPNLTAVFFNLSNKPAVSDTNVRRALGALNRQDIVNSTLTKTEIVADSVLMPHQPGYSAQPIKSQEEARKILDDAGWKLRSITDSDVEAAKAAKKAEEAGNIVALGTGQWSMKGNQGIIISLTAPETLKSVAEKIANDWKALGVKVNLKIEKDDVIQSQVIANKNFEALLFTINIENGDLYPYWTGGAAGNISSYGNKDVDTWLAEARVTSDSKAVNERYQKFQSAIANDVPAIPLYWETYVYPQTKKLKGQSAAIVETPSDRLNDATLWYFNVRRQFK